MLQATFRQLQTFVTVAHAGSFTAAANSLLISQQAISNQIRALERRLGHGLFDRRAGISATLSEKGLALLERAPTLLAQAEDVEHRVGAPRAAPPRVRVATGEHILMNVLQPELSGFQLDHPELQIEFIQFASASGVMKAVLNGQADLGYYTFMPSELNPLAEVIVVAEAGLFAAPFHPLAQDLPLKPRSGLPMILPLKSGGEPTLSERLLAHAGFPDVEVITRSQTAEMRRQLAIRGAGPCILFREFAAAELRSGRLVDLGVELPPGYRCAVRRPGSSSSDHLAAFDAFVVERLRQTTVQG